MTDDDPDQVPAARKALADADAVIVTTPTLCELVWVLSRSYRLGSARIAETIRALRSVGNVVIDHERVDRGDGATPVFEVAAIYTFNGDKIARVDFAK